MNASILRMVVAIIGAVIVIAVVGVILCVVLDKSIPGTLETITTAGITGLLGLLAPSREVTGPADQGNN